MPDFDLFISYRRLDAERVRPLVDALVQRDVSVWLDQQAISEFAPITTEIRHGLAQSKALLAWYSEAYPQSRPCQMELTAALLAARREGDPRRRVLVINPGPSGTHIEPVELRDAQYAVAPSDAAGYSTLADRIAAHVATLSGPLGGILPIVPPVQYGATLTGATRFVGRLPDLWRIHSALRASESSIISGTHASGLAIVSGFGGVGKSLLAEEYALRFGAAYPGGIFWLRAHGNESTGDPSVAGAEAVRLEQFVAMAIELGIQDLDPQQVRAQLLARLSRQGQPFLWIIDDVASGLEADALKAWLAPATVGKTLVTTRTREYAAIGAAVPLGVLTPPEALDLLCSRRAPVGPVEAAAAQDITHALGYHALAVDVAGAALAAQAGLTSFVEFRADLANPSEDELELATGLAGVLPSGHEPSVAATILRSVRHLPEEGQDFLRLAALLAVAPTPPALVAGAFRHVDNLTERDAKRCAISGQHQVEQASLAERTEGEARLVHALVSRTIRFREVRPERRGSLRAAVIAALTEVLPEIVPRTSREFPLEVLHARALLGPEGLWDLDTADLAMWVASHHDYQRGLYVVARPLQERVLEARRRVLGEDHPDTLMSMNNLAGTLWAQGDLAGARALQERGLEARRRVLGEDHSDTFTSMSNLAITLRAQGDLAGPRGLQERVLEARRRVLGEDHPDTLTSMNNLAITLGAQGDLAGARALEERVLEARRRVLGEDHSDTLTSMSNLAITLGAQGDLAGARALEERALEASRRVLGEDHPDTLTSMINLAATLRAQGDLAGARALQERGLEGLRRVLGEDHPNTLTSMSSLAETLGAQGDLAGAHAWQERALGARRRVLGEDHPDTLMSMNNLALTLWAQGDPVGARGWHERVLEARRRVLGEDHPATLMSMNNLAQLLRAQGDLAGARALQERGLEGLRRVLGEDHPDTLTSMINLGGTLWAQGDLAGARAWQERGLEGLRRVLGEDHSDTLTSMSNLAATLRGQGDLAGARGLRERVLETLRRLLGRSTQPGSRT